MLRASSCNQPRGWQSWAAGRGWRRSADSPISDRPRGFVSASGPLGDQVGISVQAGGLDWEKQGFICRVLQPFLPQVTPVPRTSKVFCSPRPEPGVGESSPTLGTRAPRGTRDFGGTGLLPPPQPQLAARLSRH